MVANDLLLDNSYDLATLNGDLFTGFSDPQSLALITVTDLNHWKQFPFLGIGLTRDIGGNFSPSEIKSKSQPQYESDGFRIDKITVSDTFIEEVKATRINNGN